MKARTVQIGEITGGLCPNGHRVCLSARCWLKERPAHHSYLVRVGGRGHIHIAVKTPEGKIQPVPVCGAVGQWHQLPGHVTPTCPRCLEVRAQARAQERARGRVPRMGVA